MSTLKHFKIAGFAVALATMLQAAPATAALGTAAVSPALHITTVVNVSSRRGDIRRGGFRLGKRSVRRRGGYKKRRYRNRRNGGFGIHLNFPRTHAPARARIGFSARHHNWCDRRYRSYRRFDGTFQPYSGGRRLCNSPFDGR